MPKSIRFIPIFFLLPLLTLAQKTISVSAGPNFTRLYDFKWRDYPTSLYDIKVGYSAMGSGEFKMDSTVYRIGVGIKGRNFNYHSGTKRLEYSTAYLSAEFLLKE